MFCAHLYLLLSHTLGVSLLPSACSNPLCRHPPLPLAVNRSCFGYSLSHLRTAAACLSRCIRHRRRSEFLPLHRGAEKCAPSYSVSTGEPRLVQIFAPCGYFHENLYKKQPAAFRKNTKRKQRAVRSWIFGENARHGSAKGADFSPTYG